jgi:hypothetical protein
MQLLLILFFCAAFALCLLLKLTWVIRAIGYPLLVYFSYLTISIALRQRSLRTAPPQSWAAIPVLALVLVLRLRRLEQSQNLELSLCSVVLNVVFLIAFLIMWWPVGVNERRHGPQLTKKQRNKERKQHRENGSST